MVRPVMHLRNALDRDVYQVVRSLVERDGRPAGELSIYDVYGSIQRSNSSLKRNKKKPLEDSIDRILAIMQEDEAQSDSEAGAAETIAQEDPAMSSNAMNRSIARSMKRQLNGTPTKRSETEKPPDRETSIAPKKRAARQDEQRPAKRPKSGESAVCAAPSHVNFEDLGGMDAVIEQFKKCIMLPLKRPDRYMRRGLEIPSGILLHGPPGCGKTMLCEALACETGVSWLPIQAPSIVSGMSGESEKALRQHFEAALEAAPCLMFIDEIDAIAPKRESAQREMERRIVGQLLTCMDDLALDKTGGKPVIVLAATNRPDSLDPALRRAGRFDKEINIGVPGAPVRESILRALTRKSEIAPDVDFPKLAKMTPGFVGADLKSLIYEAGSESDSRYLQNLEHLAAQQIEAVDATQTSMDIDNRDEPPLTAHRDEQPLTVKSPNLSRTITSYRTMNKILSDSKREPLGTLSDAITMDDFVAALPKIQPSAKREGFATIPDTTWSNIGALSSVRHQLHNAIVEPIRHPDEYERFGIAVPAGVLLWGPPGCGKTLLAKAVANESRANFISVKGPELLNKYVGESERAVRQVFFRARSSAPCVIFFDELDALVPRRDDSQSEVLSRVVNTLLTELDGLGDRTGIYVIAATNKPEMIDPAMLRPGRLGKLLFVGLPEEDERVDILRTIMQKMPVADAGLAEIARRCNDFTGADLSNLAYEAAQHAVQRRSQVLEMQDLEHALEGVQPSVSVSDLARYQRFKGHSDRKMAR